MLVRGHRSAAEAEPAEGGGGFASELCKDSYHIFSTPCYLLTRCGGLKRLPPLPPTSET